MKWYYEVYYSSTFLRNSADMDDFYDTEEEAMEEAKDYIEDTIDRWKEDGGWNDWDDYTEFTIDVDFVEDDEEDEEI